MNAKQLQDLERFRAFIESRLRNSGYEIRVTFKIHTTGNDTKALIEPAKKAGFEHDEHGNCHWYKKKDTVIFV